MSPGMVPSDCRVCGGPLPPPTGKGPVRLYCSSACNNNWRRLNREGFIKRTCLNQECCNVFLTKREDKLHCCNYCRAYATGGVLRHREFAKRRMPGDGLTTLAYSMQDKERKPTVRQYHKLCSDESVSRIIALLKNDPGALSKMQDLAPHWFR